MFLPSAKSFFIVSFLCLSLVSGVEAAHGDAPTVAVVNFDRVLRESSSGKAARAVVEDDARRREATINAAKADLSKRAEEVEKQKSVLSPSAYEQKQSEITKAAKDLQDKVQEQREELSRKNASQIQQVVGELEGVVREISKTKKLTAVFERGDRSIIYADDSIDITAEVIQALDHKKK